MGDSTFSRSSYSTSVRSFTPDGDSHVTRRAEQKAKLTGKLNPLVDPAGYGVIRRSLPRFIKDEGSDLLTLSIGLPMPVETRVDTTGSMGDNVDIALRVLPDAYELCSQMLPGYDLQMATGIFGDVCDNFPLCRPQFEMETEKLVEQLTLMVPERNGGDATEDPHYGLFGAAFLTASSINKYGLKGYDFTVSDAPARNSLDESQLTRIFGENVFAKAKENGFEFDLSDLPSTREVVEDLLNRTHAFFLQVDDYTAVRNYWVSVFGENRIVVLPDTGLLPQVQATIIGLTEGVLSLSNTADFLIENGVSKSDAERILRSVSNIPIGAQATLRAKIDKPLPQKGDLFKKKTDLWPCEAGAETASATNEGEGPGWL